jgi:signal transduction histidine kinase
VFNRLGLRNEIVLQLSLLMAASIIFVSFLIIKVSEQELLQQRILHNTSLLHLLTTNLELKNRTQQDIERQLQQILHKFRPKLGMKAIAVLDSNNSTSQAITGEISNWPDRKESNSARLSGNISTKLRYRGFLQTLFDSSENHLLVTLPINHSYSKAKNLQAYFSLNDIHSLAYQTHGYLLLYIFLVGLTLVLFGSHLLGKIVVQPIKALQQASMNIASGNLQQSVSTSGPEEIYQLMDNFNRMSQALHNSRNETEAHIQALKQINHELEQTRDELIQAEKMASIGHLAAGIAHEIGNPLGALIGYLNLLGGQNGSVDTTLSQDILDRSRKEADRIDQLVRDLLDYARPGEETSISCEPIRVIKDAVLLLNQQNSLSSNRLLLDLPEELPNVPLTQRKFQQVLINLLINARDASPEHETITLTAEKVASHVRVKITDRGEGIEPTSLPHLFDPFFTTKTQGKGRGLGLFIAHRIISDAGGKFEVESESKRGANFIILLPITDSITDET